MVCAHRIHCADPNAELMIHILLNAGLFLASNATTRLAHRVSQAERAAYLSQLTEYPPPQWSAMIQSLPLAFVILQKTAVKFAWRWLPTIPSRPPCTLHIRAIEAHWCLHMVHDAQHHTFPRQSVPLPPTYAADQAP